jgi:hypothetical protein
VAQRTIEQRHIVINNLAIRRATEELKVAEGFHQISRILMAAFDSNDFDAFELKTQIQPSEHGFQVMTAGGPPHLRWRKPGSVIEPGFGNAWSISLDLISAGGRHCGSLTALRGYSTRDLQLDINLLTSSFATTLADALQRTAIESIEFLPSTQSSALLSAQAG